MAEPLSNAVPGADGPACECRPMTPSSWAWLLSLIGCTAILSFYGIDRGAFFEPTDCWVAQTAREMLEADEWLVPRFSGEVRMQKSPGPYWAVMSIAKLRGSGVDEVDARVPNAIAGVLIVASVFWLTRRISGDRAAVFAGFAAASSALVLYWTHRGASDLGLAACTTLALAMWWVALESEPRGWKRTILLHLAYFMAGLGMIYKLPMPLVICGVPAVAYLLVRGRWSLLADWRHLTGLAVFALPWLPWILAVIASEPAAWDKWKVEYFDRYTGDLPNVEGQNKWYWLFFYLAPTAIFCLPYTISLPGAIARVFRPCAETESRGRWFLMLWFASLLVFFSSAAGKETRYFLPALPPLFCLLGIDLACLFDSRRIAGLAPQARSAALVLPLIAAVGGAVAVFMAYNPWFKHLGPYEPAPGQLSGALAAKDLLLPMCVSAAIVLIGSVLVTNFYRRAQGEAAFASMVGTMWVLWLWAWPVIFPILVSQAGFREFAQRIRECVSPEEAKSLRQIAQQDPRVIWYGSYRYPRIIDQLQLLKEQNGKRTKRYEVERVGVEMVRQLRSEPLCLFVISFIEYVQFRTVVEHIARLRGEPPPPMYVWIQPHFGRPDRNLLLIGNRPPTRCAAAPEIEFKEKWREAALRGTREILGDDWEARWSRSDAIPSSTTQEADRAARKPALPNGAP
ncbi:MAG: glycosyltransferase family 39 protein [Phycisphaerae bacterium]|nr:glycosyltransferase family 39 protein [Phycisphaerae bacterium]